MSDKLTESVTTLNGVLRIDRLNGLIIFNDGWNRTILRVSHLPEPIPDNVMIDIVALKNLTSYTPLQSQGNQHTESFQEWIDEGIEPVKDDLVKLDLQCPVCHKVHVATDFFMWGPYNFIKGHEYIIWTRNSIQTYARRGRMQFLGSSTPKYRLTFNARGPDRSQKSQYGGTQVIDAWNIVKLEEVACDPARRYVDEIDREMKRNKS